MQNFFDELKDALEDVQLCDNTAQEAEDAREEINAIVESFKGKAQAVRFSYQGPSLKPPVKEFCRSELTPGQIHFVLRLDRIARLSHVLALYAEAMRDFPTIAPGIVQVVCYGNDATPVRFGLEFTLCGVEPPEGYQEIDALELAR